MRRPRSAESEKRFSTSGRCHAGPPGGIQPALRRPRRPRVLHEDRRIQRREITVLGELIDGDLATMRTRIVGPQDTKIPVDYRMFHRGGRWVVYDVSIEGVSLVANYRAPFNKIIQTSSYQALVDKLRAKPGYTEPFLRETHLTSRSSTPI
jgi:hypothetical protein